MTDMDPFQLAERVAATAIPAAEFERFPIEGRIFDILLDDLVESHATVDRDLKEQFIRVFIDDGDMDDDDPDDPDDELTQRNLREFASTEPVVDIDHLLRTHRTAA